MKEMILRGGFLLKSQNSLFQDMRALRRNARIFMESEIFEHSNNFLPRSKERVRIDHSSICNDCALKLDGKMSLDILSENVKLKGKDKPWAGENVSPYTSSHALSSLKVSSRLHLSFSFFDGNKCQNLRAQSV